MIVSVCEKTFHEVEVPDQVTECQTVDEEVCFTDDTTEQRVCKTFPKQQCEVVNGTKKEFVPEVDCKKMETPICGPEPCPLIRAEPVCYDEVKQVRKDQTTMIMS